MISAEETKTGRIQEDGKEFVYWDIWDYTGTFILYIRTHPEPNSRAIDALQDTTKYIKYGGFYVCNCYPLIATDPTDEELLNSGSAKNDYIILQTHFKCETIVFCWGASKLVKHTGRDRELATLYPHAKVLKLHGPAHLVPANTLFLEE